MRGTFAYAAGAASVLLLLGGCGGSSGGGPPAAPSPPPASNVPAIQIVGDTGPQAFDPNPAPSPAGGRVVWRNNDNVVHRIVANDGSFDTGNIGPGATSIEVPVPSGGTNYHCPLHPGMIGAVNDAAGQAPPCTGQYC